MKNKTLIALLLIMILVGIVFYGIGYTRGLMRAVDLGIGLVKLGKINISIDEEMLKMGIVQYHNNIGSCIFLGNYTVQNHVT